MPACITTKGRIEYQLRVFEGLSVVYIEVKLEVGTGEEHLNAGAQLIAEVDGLYLRLYKGPVLTFLYTVDSLITHSSDNPYSLITHTFSGPPSWFAGKCTP